MMACVGSQAQCDHDFCGYWYSESYNAGVPVEYLAIDMVGEEIVCTKVLGDPYVPTGSVSWRGVRSGCAISGSVYATSGIGQPIIPFNCGLVILSPDHIRMSAPFYLDFFRSTTGHLDHVGVDYSEFPISCELCPSEFPNVFTPNGDGVNDLLEPICGGKSHKFKIQDRWGITVFESDEAKPVWDGRKDWTPCPTGVYFWSMIKSDDRTGKIAHGVVHLLR
jgi:gliding motility-associated-like protein